MPWPATDALGRSLPLAGETGAPRSNRFVGIFYFLWHNNTGGKSPHWNGPYDVAKIRAREPDALRKPESPLWGPIGMYHYWGEPLYGYYLSNDRWVLRRHAQLLADAGIDTLIFDTTNAQIYREVYRALCAVFTEVRAQGGRTPQIVFMVNTQAGATARKIYDDLYRPGDYRELWFYWQGKPLLICDPKEADGELREFFTLRRAHWPFTLTNTPYAWHWEATYPQPYGYTEDPNQPEQVNVSVAQNLRQKDGKVTNMSNGDARGRSFHQGRQDTQPGAVLHGHNAQEQWQRVFALDPPFVMVTGWNEWIAGRWGKPGEPLVFVDQFDQEFSRDIEPMSGGHGDNYYWQLVANVRRYKGTPALPGPAAPQRIEIEGGIARWDRVKAEYRDHVGETEPRASRGAGGLSYTNLSGRNDIVRCKVAHNEDQVYFLVETRVPLTPPNGTNWMWLFLDTDADGATGWEGFDFMVNLASGESGRLALQRNQGGWRWQPVETIAFQVQGRRLQFAIPRGWLGLTRKPFTLDFKWADHLQRPGDVLDFYTSGEVAPEARFKYRYLGE